MLGGPTHASSDRSGGETGDDCAVVVVFASTSKSLDEGRAPTLASTIVDKPMLVRVAKVAGIVRNSRPSAKLSS